VAPYNLQGNALKTGLPSGARVGTVDKFQGQEAPVCIVSMTTSSGDEIPRGVDFLFSLNRINVAVSRAQALSLVFASPRLLEVTCANIREMRLVNSLCALKEYSAGMASGAGDRSQGMLP
jgi:hypothetical protein